MEFKNIKIYESVINMIEQSSIENIKINMTKETSLTDSNVDEILDLIKEQKEKEEKIKTLINFISENGNSKKFEKEFKYNLYFGKESLEDIHWLCSLNPAFEVTLYYTNIARKIIDFPIRNYEDFEPLGKIKEHPKIKLNGINKRSLKQYFDKSMFPIDSITDFRTKIFSALTWGANCHYHEDFVKIQKQKNINYAIQSTTQLDKN
jgi:hypothetical protein